LPACANAPARGVAQGHRRTRSLALRDTFAPEMTRAAIMPHI
jgi:hypothetical protein